MASARVTLPISSTVARAPGDAGAFLGRAAAFVLSWGARDEPATTMANVLATWRAAERDLDMTTPGSAAWVDASERFVSARSEYHRLFAQAAPRADSLRRIV